jgi:tetratricopeptide (TPR) repeat protein
MNPDHEPSRATLQELFDQAIALHQSGNLAEAERLYQRAVPRKPCQLSPGAGPGEPVVLNALAGVLWQLGRQDDALECLGQLLTLRPGDIELLHRRADMLREMKRFDRVLKDYDAVLASPCVPSRSKFPIAPTGR